MPPLSKRWPPRNKEQRRGSCRPYLDALEDRLPLGDVLSWLVAYPGWEPTAFAELRTFKAEDRASSYQAPAPSGRMPQTEPAPEAAPGQRQPSAIVPEAEVIDFSALVLASTVLETLPSAFARLDGQMPMVESSNASLGPNAVLSGPSKMVLPPSAPAGQGALAAGENYAAAGRIGLLPAPLTAVPARTGVAASQNPASLGQAPLRFEANQGQTDAQVRFLAHGPGYNLFLTSSEAVMVLGRSTATSAEPAAVLRMQILGGNALAQLSGQDELPAKVNYYLGNDPAKWHTGIPTYAQVEYHDLYPGIDLLYHSRDGQLEYDFDLAPGADPAAITLAFAGVDHLGIDAQGDLVLDAAGTQVRQHQPLVYQNVNGSRQAIAGNYVLEDGQRGKKGTVPLSSKGQSPFSHVIGFQVGAYDRTRPLVIDPVLSYSTYLGGSGVDGGTGIAVDPSGRVYVTGQTSSANFPTLNALQPTLGGGLGNAFVTSLDSSGQPVYSTYLGGSGYEAGNAIAVDPSGHVYVTGVTTSANFPTQNAFQPTHGGGFNNAFVTSLDTAGQLLYSTYLGGSVNDVGAGIGVDPLGRVFVAGTTSSQDFPTRNAFQPALAGASNGFVTCLDPTGQPLYSTYLGGSGTDTVHGLAVDPSGNAYVTGQTSSADFPTLNAFQSTLTGFDNAFVTSLDSDGRPRYSTYLGGSIADYGLGIAVDASGQAYVAGTTYSANFPTRNAFQATLAGFENAFVTSLDSTGQLLYSTYLGGSNTDAGLGIAVDPLGHVYVTGPTSSTDFPTLNAFQTTYGGGLYDAFVTSLDSAGQMLYSSYLGGSREDYGTSIAADPSGHAYVTGSTASADFPTQSAFQPALGGIQNAFVAMIA